MHFQQTFTYNYLQRMPVDLRTHNPDEPIHVRPGTNEAAIVTLLYANSHLGFTPSELEEQLDMAPGSVSTTLGRLLEKGYIGKTADGLYWFVRFLMSHSMLEIRLIVL
jgi:predicted transcriptional regulator of viral defense system